MDHTFECCLPHWVHLKLQVITNDKHMAEDVSKIIVQNEDAEEGQLLNHQQVKNRTHEPSPLKCVELHDNSEVSIPNLD